jgi:hypothetical protein
MILFFWTETVLYQQAGHRRHGEPERLRHAPCGRDGEQRAGDGEAGQHERPAGAHPRDPGDDLGQMPPSLAPHTGERTQVPQRGTAVRRKGAHASQGTAVWGYVPSPGYQWYVLPLVYRE